MKTWTKFVAALAIVGFVGAANLQAADAPAGDKPAKKEGAAKGVRGKFVKVDGTNVVISQGKKGEAKEVTIATDANTKIKVDGKDATLADIKDGMMINATPETGTAKTLNAMTPTPKAK